MRQFIGIDLGTTNSAICSYDGQNVRVWKSPDQNDVTPSAIYIDKRGNRYYGQRAYDNAPRNPNNSATDQTTKLMSISSSETIYCHYSIEGGPPGKTFKLKAVANWPWGSNQTVRWSDNSYEWRRGSSGYTSWYFYNPSDKINRGTFTIRFYDGSTLIGEASIAVRVQ